MPRRRSTANDPTSLRGAINKEITRRQATDPKWSKYRLAVKMQEGGMLTPQSVYSFLRGDSRTSSEHVEEMLRLLDLVVVPRHTAETGSRALAADGIDATRVINATELVGS